MDEIQKKKEILDNIASNYKTFVTQATLKINRQIANDSSDPQELVSDVIFTIIIKLNDTNNVNRYYNMLSDNKLFAYIAKGIDTNAKRPRSPFLRKKLLLKNRIVYNDHIDLEDTPEEENTDREILKNKIQNCLTPPTALKIFGSSWKYYTKLLKEYSQPNITYKYLSDKYNIPLSSITYDILTAKKLIKKYINESN